MTPAERDRAEYDFARMMLAEPIALNRAIYADWLSDEVGDTKQAALVRKIDSLASILSTDHLWIGFYDATELFLSIHDNTLVIDTDSSLDEDSFAYIWYWIRPGHRLHFSVRSDGTSPDSDVNWAWLLSLAMDRGLRIPNLNSLPDSNRRPDDDH